VADSRPNAHQHAAASRTRHQRAAERAAHDGSAEAEDLVDRGDLREVEADAVLRKVITSDCAK